MWVGAIKERDLALWTEPSALSSTTAGSQSGKFEGNIQLLSITAKKQTDRQTDDAAGRWKPQCRCAARRRRARRATT